MSLPVIVGQMFPNMVLGRPDGTGMELYDLWKKQHALLILQDKAHPDVMAFIDRFQAEAKTFEWLQTRLLPIFPKREAVPSPWTAVGYPPLLHPGALPDGVEWGRAYVISRNRTLLDVYLNPGEVSVSKFERDMLVWEANHCLP
jgi:hypothetical protein